MARLLVRRTAERLDHVARNYGSKSNLKVAILGANGKIGQSLALCLKQSQLIDELAIYDAKPARGLLTELSHLDTKCRTIPAGPADTASGPEALQQALYGAKVVAIVGGAGNVQQEVVELEKYVQTISSCCPKVFVALVSRSVNSLLPALYELYKRYGLLDYSRLFGVLNLHMTRANRFAAECLGVDPEFVTVPVIGGGCIKTCVPLFSRTRPCAAFTTAELARLTQAMKSADARVVEAYGYSTGSAESSPLCAGFSAARFCISLCKALRGEEEVVECAYVRSCLMPEVKYLGEPLELGRSGIQRRLGLPPLNANECRAFYAALPDIKRAIGIGETLVLGARKSTEACPVPQRCLALQPCSEPDVDARVACPPELG